VEAVLAETDDRVTAAAVLARVGRPKKGKQDNSRKRESLGKGQTRDYTLARLRRDDPEMAARVERHRPSMRFDVRNVGRAGRAKLMPCLHGPVRCAWRRRPRRRGNAGALSCLW
jgi:hypothetical protein